MLFSPRESGQSLVETAVLIAVIVLFLYVAYRMVVVFYGLADDQNPCGVFEFNEPGC